MFLLTCLCLVARVCYIRFLVSVFQISFRHLFFCHLGYYLPSFYTRSLIFLFFFFGRGRCWATVFVKGRLYTREENRILSYGVVYVVYVDYTRLLIERIRNIQTLPKVYCSAVKLTRRNSKPQAKMRNVLDPGDPYSR